jgi:hypothetical protein
MAPLPTCFMVAPSGFSAITWHWFVELSSAT